MLRCLQQIPSSNNRVSPSFPSSSPSPHLPSKESRNPLASPHFIDDPRSSVNSSHHTSLEDDSSREVKELPLFTGPIMGFINRGIALTRELLPNWDSVGGRNSRGNNQITPLNSFEEPGYYYDANNSSAYSLNNKSVLSIEYICERNYASDALESVVSALYCKIIIIFGLAFPMSEVISSNVPPGYYQLFYIYLFLGSLAYLIIIYVDLLRTRASIAVTRTKLMMKAKKCETENSLKRTISGSGETEEDDYNLSSSAAALSAINYKDGIPRPRVHYGSFYLRFGAVIFGIGSMIYSGIEIGMVFELNMANVSKCKNIFSIIRPILQMIFVFVQMYFIFLNQKMNIYKSKLMSRFGLMHMIATNICVWFNVLILETSHEILGHGPHHHTNGDGTQPTPISDDHSSNDSHHSNGGQHTQIPEAHYLTDEVPNSDYSKGMEFQLSHLVI
ncbi:Proton channel OtopLc [Lepeophtheirus salmonis]|uniref:Proton channel OtopLc n=1 Tax=Lepeophtheirus salmonis TaxID=72036 RepID=A0A7R8H7S9_LEPSM|nr:Proton channel OtopLc [Lepeophtheirus salmonis]CAF2907754.1 Proton channel OtopLc [Lepeophtheirus salmonis]